VKSGRLLVWIVAGAFAWVAVALIAAGLYTVVRWVT
jgi:hypothetical protein